MKNLKKILLILITVFLSNSIHSQYIAEPAVYKKGIAIEGDCGLIRKVAIYGEDDREEYCAQDIVIRELANAVVALFADDGISIRKEKVKEEEYYRFGTITVGEAYNLARGERFRDQPSLAFCTGFLVSEDLVVTAGHCIRDPIENPSQGQFCKDIKIVFGYRKELGGYIPLKVSTNSVYNCSKVIAHSYKSGPDYAIIKLDRKVKNIKPLAINRENSNLKKDTSLIVIGHPSGLPLKVTKNAKVIKIDETMNITLPSGTTIQWINPEHYFLTNLDTFGGNSGSPVINAKTLMVEGILVRGDEDYKQNPLDPSTNIASTYPEIPISTHYGQGVGEVATKISVLEKHIPQTTRETEMVEWNKKAKGNLYDALMNYLLEYQRRLKRDKAIPIPNFPDDNRGANIKPAIYYPPSPPQPRIERI